MPHLDQRARAGGIARGADARDLGDHVVGRLAQVRQAVRVAGRQRHQHQRRRRPSMRALGALQVRAPAPRRRGPAASARTPALRRCRPAAAAAAPARTSRPRSRAGRRRTRRGSIRAWRRWARRAAMLCRPSRRPTSRIDDAARQAARRSVVRHGREFRISNPTRASLNLGSLAFRIGISPATIPCATSTSPPCACSSRSARLGNIARAGEQANIVGSAISKRLAQLEDQVGTPLLVRTPPWRRAHAGRADPARAFARACSTARRASRATCRTSPPARAGRCASSRRSRR